MIGRYADPDTWVDAVFASPIQNPICISQIQTHEKIGMDFATALKALLRQDPDVIMVGEIRDMQTSTIAIQAALTGHLVLSTLHTNDAPSSITMRHVSTK